MDTATTLNTQATPVKDRRRANRTRRTGQDRRKNLNANYSGPSRRLLLDRRLQVQDRRQ